MPRSKTTNPLADLNLPPLMELSTAEALKKAGYDLDDERDTLFALIAFGAAIRVFNAAIPPPEPERGRKVGRNDPCPCGSGRKYKKCCARAPGRPASSSGSPPRAQIDLFDLIPRFAVEEWFAEDLSTLTRLFQEDPDLKEIRFAKHRLRDFLLQAARDEGGEDLPPEFYHGVKLRYLLEVEPPSALGDLTEQMLKAVPRWLDDPSALRSLALGVALEVLENTVEEEDPSDTGKENPLYTTILELTIKDLLEDEERWMEWLEDVGGPEGVQERLAKGEPFPIKTFPVEIAHQFIERLQEEGPEAVEAMVREIREGGLPVGLPFASVLPCLVRIVLSHREGIEPTPEQVIRFVEDTAEELGPEDAELFDLVLAEWVEEHGDEADEATLTRVGIVRSVLTSYDGFGPLGPTLVLITMRDLNFTEMEGAPPLPMEEGQSAADGITPEFLERYGDFLWEEDLPAMALRTWNLCRLFGPLSPSVREKLSRMPECDTEDGPTDE